MRKRIVTAALIVAVTGLTAAWWGVAGAQSFRSGDSVTIAAGETVDHTVWLAGRTVDVAGQVNGDVFCAAQNVSVSGTIRGDLLCAAQTITVSGVITGDVRTAAQTVTVSGTIIRNLTAAAQNFSQPAKGNVSLDASIAAADIVINGAIGRDVAASGQSIQLSGPVTRNVEAAAGRLQLNRGARVGGNLDYTSHNDVRIAEGASVAGTTTKSAPPERQSGGFGSVLYMLVAGLVVALALAALFPQAIHTITNQGERAPWRAMLVGLVASVVVPILIVLLLLTVLGIPLALLLAVVWLLLLTLSGVLSAYLLGRKLWRRQHNPLLIMLAGAGVLLILYIIPVIGFIALLAALLLGTGMILLELNRRRPTPRYKV